MLLTIAPSAPVLRCGPEAPPLPGCQLPCPSEPGTPNRAAWRGPGSVISVFFELSLTRQGSGLHPASRSNHVASASQLSSPAQARLPPRTQHLRGGQRTSESVPTSFSGLTRLSAPHWSFGPPNSLIPHLTPAPLHPLPTGTLSPTPLPPLGSEPSGCSSSVTLALE